MQRSSSFRSLPRRLAYARAWRVCQSCFVLRDDFYDGNGFSRRFAADISRRFDSIHEAGGVCQHLRRKQSRSSIAVSLAVRSAARSRETFLAAGCSSLNFDGIVGLGRGWTQNAMTIGPEEIFWLCGWSLR